jgi:iron-sulfur cluster repair protein YtfE (RIC family)
MKSSRRHESLVPLSREHHYGLMLCLRIHRGLTVHKGDREWLERKREQVVEFFESDLIAHFKAEEEVLFPSMHSLSGASAIIEELLSQHRKVESLTEELRRMEIPALGDKLNEFADLLEAHIRKEERELFPIYEREAPDHLAREVAAGITGIIGTAMQPKNPDLLS